MGRPSCQRGGGERIDYTVDEVDAPEGYGLSDVSRAEEDGSYVFSIASSAKAAAPTPSGDGEEDPSKPNTQGTGDASNKTGVQNKVVKKVTSVAERRDLAKTGDSAGAEAAVVFAAGPLCAFAAALRARLGERG